MDDVEEEFKELYTRHYDSIKTRVIRGRIKDMFHFLITSRYKIREYIDTIKAEYKKDIKINVALGFIVKQVETGVAKFFHPSNNTMLFKLPVKINGDGDYIKLRDDLEKDDLVEFARMQRPSTKWRVAKLVCLRFDVTKLT